MLCVVLGSLFVVQQALLLRVGWVSPLRIAEAWKTTRRSLPSAVEAAEDSWAMHVFSRAYYCERNEWPRTMVDLEEFVEQTSEIIFLLSSGPGTAYPFPGDRGWEKWKEHEDAELLVDPDGTLAIRFLSGNLGRSTSSVIEVRRPDCSRIVVRPGTLPPQ